MERKTPRPAVRWLALMGLLAVVGAACTPQGAVSSPGTEVPGAGQEPTTEPAPEPPTPSATPVATPSAEPTTAVEDGTYPALVVTAEAGTVTVDRIEILSGAAAAAARAEDGVPPVEEGVDIPYLRNRNPRLRTLPVAEDVTVRVYDCSGGCQLVPWTYADMVAGRDLPYGSPETPFEVTVRDGRVVAMSEVYLA